MRAYGIALLVLMLNATPGHAARGGSSMDGNGWTVSTHDGTLDVAVDHADIETVVAALGRLVGLQVEWIVPPEKESVTIHMTRLSLPAAVDRLLANRNYVLLRPGRVRGDLGRLLIGSPIEGRERPALVAAAPEPTSAVPVPPAVEDPIARLATAAVVDPSRQVRDGATTALARLDYAPIDVLLAVGQSDESWRVRARALRAVADRADESLARSTLADAAREDRHPAVRRIAREALERLEQQPPRDP